MWFFWLLINVRYPLFHKLQGWQSLLQHRVQGEFHGRWDGRRWTHDISACTSEQLTFGQWSYFPTDPLSEISNNLIWSYLKCCLRLISCSHGCDHVCGVVAWRFCLCGLPHLLISLFCVLGSSNFLEDFEEWLYLWSYYYLDQRGACVCACLNLSLAVWTSFSVAVGCSTLVLLSCIWTYVFSMYFGKEMVNYDINKCLFCKSAIYPWR